MADRYLLESSATDGYLLEDGTGVLLLEDAAPPAANPLKIVGAPFAFAGQVGLVSTPNA